MRAQRTPRLGWHSCCRGAVICGHFELFVLAAQPAPVRRALEGISSAGVMGSGPAPGRRALLSRVPRMAVGLAAPQELGPIFALSVDVLNVGE